MSGRQARERLRELTAQLAIPVVVAPMFLASGPELVVAACRAGVAGAFPTPNARTTDDLERWIGTIAADVADATGPLVVNVVAHRTYDRLQAELEVLSVAAPPIVVTALGSPQRVLDAVHAWGGLVLADISTLDQAERALAAGADGLVAVCAGSGGHTGRYSPFALIPEVRRRWDGPIIAGGAVGTGGAVAAMQSLGADLAYVGTRFLATNESMIGAEYRRLVIDAGIDDIVTSAAVTGVPANWLRTSLDRHMESVAGARDDDGTTTGVGRTTSRGGGAIDFSGDIATERSAWRDVWSAGQGVGTVTAAESVQQVVSTLTAEYRHAVAALAGQARPVEVLP